MYKYVEDKDFLKRARKWCVNLLNEVNIELRKKDLATQFFLVGSSGRNMITQNENESFDFDYNFNIIKCIDWKDAREIKELIRKALNEAMKNRGLSDVEDSRSSLSSKTIYFNSEPNKKFSIDICIVTKDTSGNWHRLIHEKTGDTHYDKYYWNIAPNSNEYNKKAIAIKKAGFWNDVRLQYLKIKNIYLCQNNQNHPSFVCYIETINNVYNELKKKRIIK